MPKLPDYIAQQGLDIGSTPQAEVSTAPAQALEELGHSVQDVADRYMRIQEQRQAVQASADTDLHNVTQNGIYADYKANAPANGVGYHDGYMAIRQKNDDDFIASQPENLQPALKQSLAVAREQDSIRAASDERNIAGTYQAGIIDNKIGAGQQAINQDPAQLSNAVAAVNAQIDMSPDLTAAQKADAKAAALTKLQVEQSNRLYGNDPAAMAAHLGYSQPGTTAGQAAGGTGEQNVLLDAIAKGESGDKSNGGKGSYDSVFGDGEYGTPGKPVTQLTVNEAIAAAKAIRQNPNNNNNAGPLGRYQFVGSTIQALSKQMGLTGNEQFTPQLQDAMAWQNLKDTGGDPSKIRAQWVSWQGKSDSEIHQLWQQGMQQHDATMANGGPYYAAAGPSNAMSADRIPDAAPGAVAGNGIAPTPHPDTSAIPFDMKQKLVEDAQRTQSDQVLQLQRQNKQQTDTLVNNLENGILDNKAGMADIQQAYKQGFISDAGTRQHLMEMVTKRDADTGNASNFFAAANTPNYQWNPLDPKQQDAADAAYKQLGGGGNQPGLNVDAMDKVFRTSGIVPKSGALDLRGALYGTDQQAGTRALQVASNIMAKNPNAFKGDPNSADIQNATVSYQHYIGLGDSTATAVQKVMQANDPAYKSKIVVTDDGLKDFKAGITAQTIGKSYDSSWLPFNDPTVGSTPDQQSSIVADFREAAADAYKTSGDPKLAMAQAQAQLSKVYGVTNAFGSQTLTKYPLEKAYPQVANDDQGGLGYVYRQAVSAIYDHDKATVAPSDIAFLPIPNATQSAFSAGNQPVPYTLAYMAADQPGGQKTLHIMSGANGNTAFIADPAAGAAEVQAKIAPQFQAAQAFQQQQQTEAAQGPALEMQRLQMMNPQENYAQNRREWPPAPVQKVAPAPVPGKAQAAPTGGDAFQDLKSNFGNNGGDGMGGSGVGM